MSSSNEAKKRSNKDKHFPVNKSGQQDPKEEQEDSVETTTTIDITKAGNTSKDILDIIDTPDVATWNKGTQMKGNAADTIKRSKDRGEEVKGITQGKITPTNAITTIELREKGSDGLTIDPANKEDVSKVVKSRTLLTDKAKETYSIR